MVSDDVTLETAVAVVDASFAIAAGIHGRARLQSDETPLDVAVVTVSHEGRDVANGTKTVMFPSVRV